MYKDTLRIETLYHLSEACPMRVIIRPQYTPSIRILAVLVFDTFLAACGV